MVTTNKHCEDYTTICCRHCGVDHVIFYGRYDMLLWLSGSKHIQDAMPYLSSSDRELILSNTCGKCFDKLFSLDIPE